MTNVTNIQSYLVYSRRLFLLSTLLSILSACVDNKYIIDDYRLPGTSKDKNVVYFLPRLESNVATRVLTPFPEYCLVKIFVFDYYGTQSSITSPVYRSLEPGTLSPSQGQLTLINGTYNFYAVSLKEDSLPPKFTNNVATELYNNKDYLWCGVTDQMISHSGTTIPITFNHVATQIVVNVVNKDTTNPAAKVLSATISGPETTSGITWNLTTGVISPATSLASTGAAIQVDGMATSYIMLPVAVENGKLSYLAVVQQSQGQVVSCNVDIPFPEGGYLAGHSYQYDMYFDIDGGSLAEVVVAPWKDVTVSSDVNEP